MVIGFLRPVTLHCDILCEAKSEDTVLTRPHLGRNELTSLLGIETDLRNLTKKNTHSVQTWICGSILLLNAVKRFFT